MQDIADMPDGLNEIQQMFFVYAAIKRAINITARMKHTHTFAIALSNALTCRLVGKDTNGKDNMVCIQSNLLNL